MDVERRQYEFSGFRVDVMSRELFDPSDKPLSLTSRALDVLVFLIEHRDRVVSKEELLAAVWVGRVVEENNLTHAISSLRKVFGVGAGEHHYIRTFPTRGYRFVADLTDGAIAAGRRATDPAAERLYLAARDLIDAPNSSRAKRAIGMFRQVLDIDPSHSRAWSGLAAAWRELTMTGDMDPKRAFPLAKAAVERALALDPASPEAHAARACNLLWNDWDWQGAELACQRAIELGPCVPDGHFTYAHLLNNLGRFDEALAQARIARELNPVAPLINLLESVFLAIAGRIGEAEARMTQALEIAPDFWVALLVRAVRMTEHGEPAAAVAAIEHVAKLSGRNSNVLAMLASALVETGNRAGAERLSEELQTLSAATYIPGTSRAAISNVLGDQDEALDLLELAFEQHDVRMTFLKTDSRWNNLRPHPRFQVLTDRMGFAGGVA